MYVYNMRHALVADNAVEPRPLSSEPDFVDFFFSGSFGAAWLEEAN